MQLGLVEKQVRQARIRWEAAVHMRQLLMRAREMHVARGFGGRSAAEGNTSSMRTRNAAYSLL